MSRFFVFFGMLFLGSIVNASDNIEINKKIQYFAVSGFGDEGDQGAFSLENADIPTGSCLWDVIIFDQQFQQTLKAAYENSETLKKVIFSVNEETGDCTLSLLE